MSQFSFQAPCLVFLSWLIFQFPTELLGKLQYFLPGKTQTYPFIYSDVEHAADRMGHLPVSGMVLDPCRLNESQDRAPRLPGLSANTHGVPPKCVQILQYDMRVLVTWDANTALLDLTGHQRNWNVSQ